MRALERETCGTMSMLPEFLEEAIKTLKPTFRSASLPTHQGAGGISLLLYQPQAVRQSDVSRSVFVERSGRGERERIHRRLQFVLRSVETNPV